MLLESCVPMHFIHGTILLCSVICLQTMVAKGFKANEWISSVSAILNAKGGGRDEAAQCTGTDVSKVFCSCALVIDKSKCRGGFLVGVVFFGLFLSELFSCLLSFLFCSFGKFHTN